jgi:hypothetical protein
LQNSLKKKSSKLRTTQENGFQKPKNKISTNFVPGQVKREMDAILFLVLAAIIFVMS